MLGWSRLAASSASRRNRSRSSAVAIWPDKIILRATSRFKRLLPGLENHPHPPPGDLLEDLVIPDAIRMSAGLPASHSSRPGRGGRNAVVPSGS